MATTCKPTLMRGTEAMSGAFNKINSEILAAFSFIERQDLVMRCLIDFDKKEGNIVVTFPRGEVQSAQAYSDYLESEGFDCFKIQKKDLDAGPDAGDEALRGEVVIDLLDTLAYLNQEKLNERQKI